jgi:hypothetical protein
MTAPLFHRVVDAPLRMFETQLWPSSHHRRRLGWVVGKRL